MEREPFSNLEAAKRRAIAIQLARIGATEERILADIRHQADVDGIWDEIDGNFKAESGQVLISVPDHYEVRVFDSIEDRGVMYQVRFGTHPSCRELSLALARADMGLQKSLRSLLYPPRWKRWFWMFKHATNED